MEYDKNIKSLHEKQKLSEIHIYIEKWECQRRKRQFLFPITDWFKITIQNNTNSSVRKYFWICKIKNQYHTEWKGNKIENNYARRCFHFCEVI